MIPPPVDPILLREHAYQETGDLGLVLNKNKFTGRGGYKPILNYGLGYFNYDMSLKDEVYSKSYCSMLKGHIQQHFLIYFILFLISSTFWIAFFFFEFHFLRRITKGSFKNINKKNKLRLDDDEESRIHYDDKQDQDYDYHHFKI
ncbi:uncharacterized protein NDAI_0A00510 [Naumovozyma dairenensis CBS 421]|uniref:PIR Superfamily Protein n=1 Tax=Naumovozyma dairenensis (strain ATCC 10597 / BCRC 20456 / CBS 421 / NBRC 0211 / NRRL Y-12639) TaxID=1071378 RepID=G0W321_NAUDC|nr:hypothetical protein NDAI_0A00510 [Naumovozyma dairenensis CBS 421]CCD22209.1 hypothetical protein NDAI_0A00510 [Naumovozyma dairenensis CBS 421]